MVNAGGFINSYFQIQIVWQDGGNVSKQHATTTIKLGVIMLDKDLKDDYGFQWIDLWDRTKNNKETENVKPN